MGIDWERLSGVGQSFGGAKGDYHELRMPPACQWIVPLLVTSSLRSHTGLPFFQGRVLESTKRWMGKKIKAIGMLSSIFLPSHFLPIPGFFIWSVRDSRDTIWALRQRSYGPERVNSLTSGCTRAIVDLVDAR